MKHCSLFSVLLVCVLFVASGGCAAEVDVVSKYNPTGQLDPSLRNEVTAAVDRALSWLATKQREDGAWSNTQFPALTALVVQSYLATQHPKRATVLPGALDFITSCVQPDGGIYVNVPGRKGGGLSNYNTAICMTALHATGDDKYLPLVLKARKFVADGQHFGGDEYNGGFGYDRSTGRSYTDLLNTFYATQAMRVTQSVEDKRPAGEKRVDIDWEATAKFVSKLQNPSGTGDEAGGFFYNPSDPKAGTTTNAQGVVTFRSYGSITYAGLLALIYADVSRDDPRVRSAFDWSAKHWTLKENPGMGGQGLYFFFNVLTRSLDAYGQDLVPTEGGKMIDWRIQIARRLVAAQKVDPDTGGGYWINDTGRFWESDPVLATAYSLLALQLTL
ncbi:MAG: terpene cyclase/mutase family protein [Kiritimatiellia bacterium]|jgi:squalene-hopene/tetraprenyl-beta-curcumene cyclase|nr:terpene cyclase/mutase family protein [Kiritimatiellia bacterium]MDP6810300.1 terpene cyclase/mutase family protein [Kiritimatiellia bacterium]MDP7022711.1 terpene cyclase/mutase family protein [Kiritimatiellia bacterium]